MAYLNPPPSIQMVFTEGETASDILEKQPSFDLLREKVNANTEQIIELSDCIFTFENLPNQDELQKVTYF
jgi:hypothetical protein